ncbi:MAG: dienelactone hydrolase family protein [Pseudolabrys sp.]|nr:dienelactone hydrolase family protein [Pseudolabrys sp.]
MPPSNLSAAGIAGAAVDIRTPDGIMDSYVAHPGGGSHALVLLLMDIWGLREALYAAARRLAGRGYYCIVPNLFYREGKVRYARHDANGKMVPLDHYSPDEQHKIRSSGWALNRAGTRSDLAAILDFCRGQPVDDGPAGTVGFCLGGRIAFYAGQELPGRFCANASLHGTLLVTDAPDSPHRLVDRMRGEVYCGYGASDSFGAPAIRDTLARAFAGNRNVAYRSNLHPGADHGYALADRDVYDAAAVETDWREILAMFERQLARSA